MNRGLFGRRSLEAQLDAGTVTPAMLRVDASNAMAIVGAARPQLEELDAMFRRAAEAMSFANPRDSALNNYALSLSRATGVLDVLAQLRSCAEEMLRYGLQDAAGPDAPAELAQRFERKQVPA